MVVKKQNYRLIFQLTIIFLSLVVNPLSVFAITYDDFDDNTLNTGLWEAITEGGPIIEETNQRVEVTFPSDSTGDPFVGVYQSICNLNGDFDIQVDYQFLVWPPNNGVRTALYAEGIGSAQRTSFSTHDSQPTGEYYLIDFGYGGSNLTPTTNQSGTLRLVRTGNQITAYYLDSSSGWVEIAAHSPITTGDVFFQIAVWSHDSKFDDQEVKVAFDNFIVNEGQLVDCNFTPIPTLTEWGIIIFMTLMMGIGVVVLYRRRIV